MKNNCPHVIGKNKRIRIKKVSHASFYDQITLLNSSCFFQAFYGAFQASTITVPSIQGWNVQI